MLLWPYRFSLFESDLEVKEMKYLNGAAPSLVIGVAIAAVLISILMGLMHRQVSQDFYKGTPNHMRRGRVIPVLAVLALAVLEIGVHLDSNFKPQATAFTIHMVFAIPTGAFLVILLPLSGWIAHERKLWAWLRYGAAVCHKALNFWRLPLWLTYATLATGFAFLVISVYRPYG